MKICFRGSGACRIEASGSARFRPPRMDLRIASARVGLSVGVLCCFGAVGCGPERQAIPERRPRPVLVSELTRRLPPNASLVSGSVESWKTEEIGFEVGGRVEFVVEPSTEIEGRIHDKQGQLIAEGTPIGRLESERYRLQVARAEAEVVRAEQNLLAARAELDQNLPAQIAAATANRDLAKIEFERSGRLLARNAGSQSEVDRDKANFDSAEAELRRLDASTKAKAADIESLKNAVLQAKQNLRDAERNVEDCTLYASYGGQIAEIDVVPGSVVSAGQPVATLQMMDPIKVELEVSAEDSRRLQRRERLPVVVTLPDGSQETRDGYLYLIDPIADPLTRTFSVTLLVMNEELVDSVADPQVAATNDIWRLDFKFLPAPEQGMLFIEEEALLRDDTGYYLWMITNITIQDHFPLDESRLKVRKMRVTPGSLKIPYLGNWVFQHVIVNDDEFDPKVHLVAGKLRVTEGEPEQWNGDTVVRRTEGQWMLRPGDLVRVDLTGGIGAEGFYVPMDAITREQGQASIFTVTETDGRSKANRVPIRLVSENPFAPTSSLRRIEPVQAGTLEGVSYVVKGAHYLIDGEIVNAVRATEAAR